MNKKKHDTKKNLLKDKDQLTIESLQTNIPKSSVKKTHYYEMKLLERKSLYFLNATILETDNEFVINYEVDEDIISFHEIKQFSNDVKLRYLLNIAKLNDIRSSRYTFTLDPKELYFSKDGLPLIKTRGIKHIVEPLPILDEDFLIRYKALIISAFNEKVSFESLVEGNLALHKGTQFEDEIIEQESLEDLTTCLTTKYNEAKERYSNNYTYIERRKYTWFKWSSIVLSVIVVAVISYLLYFFLSVQKFNEQVDDGYRAYVNGDNTKVLTKLNNLNGRNLDKESLYIYARSYIETNEQGLENAKKENLLNNITTSTNKDYLLFWHALGQGDIDEALNIATYLDDKDIMKLALINKINEIKNNPKLDSDKRSEETNKYNEKLQSIIDKEKELKESEEKTKEEKAKQKEEALKQQEENEKKQKEQQLKEKEAKRKEEREK